MHVIKFGTLFSTKILVIRAETHKILVRLANREDPDQSLIWVCECSVCLDLFAVRNYRTFYVRNYITFTIYIPIVVNICFFPTAYHMLHLELNQRHVLRISH